MGNVILCEFCMSQECLRIDMCDKEVRVQWPALLVICNLLDRRSAVCLHTPHAPPPCHKRWPILEGGIGIEGIELGCSTMGNAVLLRG